jgi:hypothetical protein
MVSEFGINGSSISLAALKMAAIRPHFKFPFSDCPEIRPENLSRPEMDGATFGELFGRIYH